LDKQTGDNIYIMLSWYLFYPTRYILLFSYIAMQNSIWNISVLLLKLYVKT